SQRHALVKLVAAVLLAGVIPLDHRKADALHPLIGSEALAAMLAAPPPLDGLPVRAQAAVGHLRIFTVAIRTSHDICPRLRTYRVRNTRYGIQQYAYPTSSVYFPV